MNDDGPQPMFYLLTNQKRGALYAGVTRWPLQRLQQHRLGLIDGFSKRYGTRYLIHYELFSTIADAIVRERRVKEWRRAWKVELIETGNPTWRDLALDLGFEPIRHPCASAYSRTPSRTEVPRVDPGFRRDDGE